MFVQNHNNEESKVRCFGFVIVNGTEEMKESIDNEFIVNMDFNSVVKSVVIDELIHSDWSVHKGNPKLLLKLKFTETERCKENGLWSSIKGGLSKHLNERGFTGKYDIIKSIG